MSKRKVDDDNNFRINKRPRADNRKYQIQQQEDEIEDSIEYLIVCLGDKPSVPLNDSLNELVKTLYDESKPNDSNLAAKIICESVIEMPEKTCIYSTLVGLLNHKNYHYGGEIVEVLVKYFKDYLRTCQWERVRTMVRFLGDLVNCHVISVASYMNLLETFVDVTMEDNIPQSRSGFFVYAVLSALPWVGLEINENKEQDLEQLLSTIDNYLNKRVKSHHTALRVWYSDTPHPQEEYLDCLWAQISKLRSDKWIEKHINRPYAFIKELTEALPHNLPSFSIPPHEPSHLYPYPKVIFRLFDYTDCGEGPVLPGAHSIERYLIEEHCRFIMDSHIHSIDECATALLAAQGKHKIPLEYVLVEVIFSELFAQPTHKYLEIFYGSLVLKLCRFKPDTLPKVLAQAVELLIDRLDTMNVACVDRFSSWFSYHLSNFQYAWSWDDMSEFLKLDPLHPKPKFLRETLIRCIRFSYHQRIVELVPESFRTMLPDSSDPINKFTSESVLGYDVSLKLKQAMLSRSSDDDILNILESIPDAVIKSEDDVSDLNLHNVKIEVFFTTLLNVASKTLTHLLAYIRRYNKVLEALNTCEDAQKTILKTIFDVWKNRQQIMIILIEKLIKAGIVGHRALLNWIFSKDMSSEFTKSYIWEILHATISRQSKLVESYQKEFDDMQQKNEKIDEGDKSGGDIEKFPNDAIDKVEEKLDTAQSELKTLFLTVFQHFIMLLSEHIQRCETQNVSFKNYWFRWSIGRLQQVFFEHHHHVFKYISALESLLFTNDLDRHILLIFRQFSSLQS